MSLYTVLHRGAVHSGMLDYSELLETASFLLLTTCTTVYLADQVPRMVLIMLFPSSFVSFSLYIAPQLALCTYYVNISPFDFKLCMYNLGLSSPPITAAIV